MDAIKGEFDVGTPLAAPDVGETTMGNSVLTENGADHNEGDVVVGTIIEALEVGDWVRGISARAMGFFVSVSTGPRTCEGEIVVGFMRWGKQKSNEIMVTSY